MNSPKILCCTALLFSLAMLSLAEDTRLPAQFDLRNVSGQDYVSGVRSQFGGTCWTHGAMAAMEGNLMMSGNWTALGESGEPDLAEYHLDWWNGFNDHNNDDINPPSGSGLEIHQGGDYRVTSAYLSRGEGAVRDIDGQSYDAPPDRWKSTYHQFVPREIVWLTAGEDLSSIDTIKQALMNDGVVGTCMFYDDAYIDGNFIHYQPASATEDPNHAVAIVGWDDTKAVSGAPEPGAWIVKNSWGSGWGLNGYFWISYWDKHCGKHPEMGAVSFRGVAPPDWDLVYYHDYHGWRDTWTGGRRGFAAFVADRDESLESLSFFTTTNNVSVIIRVWDRYSGGILADLLSSETTSYAHTGFHILDLQTVVGLIPGDDFYVELEVSGGGLAFDRTSEVPVLLGAKSRTTVESSAAVGESFVDPGTGWVDFTTIDSTGDLCIKAMTSLRGLKVREETAFQAGGPVGGPFSPGSANYTIECHGSQTISWEVLVPSSAPWLQVVGAASGTLAPGETAVVTLGITGDANSLQSGAYPAEFSFVNSSDHTGDTTRDAVLLVGNADVVATENMDSDPGWSTEGQWAWGVPQGQAGDHGAPDPTAGATGSNVYGYNLLGGYADNLSPQALTTTSFDCSNLYGVHLHFKRWLGVEEPQYDHASISVSTDGSSWMEIWSNDAEIDDGQWVEADLDLSNQADGMSSLRVRWTMGATDGGWNFCGWNIDDVEIHGYQVNRNMVFTDGFESGGFAAWSWITD